MVFETWPPKANAIGLRKSKPEALSHSRKVLQSEHAAGMVTEKSEFKL